MKGPLARKYLIRRHWLCPNCGRRTWTGGHIVTMECRCCDPREPTRPICMNLVEEPPRRTEAPARSVEQHDVPLEATDLLPVDLPPPSA